MNIIEQFEKDQIKSLVKGKKIPQFHPGDTVRVNVKVREGTRERVQGFEGVCIAKKNRGLSSSFTVRKISFGEGVERTFALYSPVVSSIKVVRSGKVKRAKLYYLRDRKGKSARIAEKIRKNIGIDVEVKDQETTDSTKTISTESKETSKVEIKKEEVNPTKKTTEKKETKKQENLKK